MNIYVMLMPSTTSQHNSRSRYHRWFHMKGLAEPVFRSMTNFRQCSTVRTERYTYLASLAKESSCRCGLARHRHYKYMVSYPRWTTRRDTT